MATAAPATLLLHLHRLAAGSADDVSDSELLRRFTGEGDARAFAALLQRHGPMVWAACRRILPHLHDAEDVFQATFVVLARKARSLRKHGSVGSWLYGIASRQAMRVRSAQARRRGREAQAAQRSSADPLEEITLR